MSNVKDPLSELLAAHVNLTWVKRRLQTLQDGAFTMGFHRLSQDLGVLVAQLNREQERISTAHGNLIVAKVADAMKSSRTTLAAALAGAGQKTLVDGILADCDQPVADYPARGVLSRTAFPDPE